MRDRTFAVLRRGVEAAMIAGVPQVIVPKIEEYLFLDHPENADLGPNLIDALAKKVGKPLPEDLKWIAASAFHFGYSAFWGSAYAVTHERFRWRPWVGGLGLAALLHLITFTPWVAAVLIKAEEHPRHRTWKKEVVLITAPLTFGLLTALIYDNGPTGSDSEW
ncbi:MAG: hypothetical protein ABI718_13890 [Acidobacteriota bacterium]